MADTTTQLTTIGLKEVLASLTKADAAKYNDIIPISRGGKNYYLTPMMLKEWNDLNRYEVRDFGENTLFDDLLADAILDFEDNGLKTMIGVGVLETTSGGIKFKVGLTIKFYSLYASEKRYIIEVSGPINYDFEGKKFKNLPAHPTLKAEINSDAPFIRTFHKEYHNGQAITEWDVEGGHYFLGNYKQAGDDLNNGSGAEKNALFPTLSGNASISTMHYTCNGNTKGSGLIIQQVTNTSTQQILYWDDKVYIRHIKFTDETRTSIVGNDNDYKFVRLSSYIYENWDKASASKNGLMSSKMYSALKQLATAANITID